jgi:hypothetical protein
MRSARRAVSGSRASNRIAVGGSDGDKGEQLGFYGHRHTALCTKRWRRYFETSHRHEMDYDSIFSLLAARYI